MDVPVGWGNVCVCGGLAGQERHMISTRHRAEVKWICSEFASFWSGSSSLALTNHAGWQCTCGDHLADLAETVGILGRVEGGRREGQGAKEPARKDTREHVPQGKIKVMMVFSVDPEMHTWPIDQTSNKGICGFLIYSSGTLLLCDFSLAGSRGPAHTHTRFACVTLQNTRIFTRHLRRAGGHYKYKGRLHIKGAGGKGDCSTGCCSWGRGCI